MSGTADSQRTQSLSSDTGPPSYRTGTRPPSDFRTVSPTPTIQSTTSEATIRNPVSQSATSEVIPRPVAPVSGQSQEELARLLAYSAFLTFPANLTDTEDSQPLALRVTVTDPTAVRHHGPDEHTVFAALQGYQEPSASAVPTMKYGFSPLSFNSMVVVPSEQAQDSRPVYHISIQLNCFMPSSFITTVRRGGTEHGKAVGVFEMGVTPGLSNVCMRGMEYNLDSILQKSKSKKKGPRKWTWDLDAVHLYWLCHSTLDAEGNFTPFSCKLKDGDIELAEFMPSPCLIKPRRISYLPILKVTPAGQKYLDDVVMSILIIERKRQASVVLDPRLM